MSGQHALGHWYTNAPKHYPRLSSGSHKRKYLHRAVFEVVAGRPVRAGFTVHHMNGKLCTCPHQLLECPVEFNPRTEIRDPHTGQFLSKREYANRYA